MGESQEQNHKKIKDPHTYIFIDESGKPEIYSSRGVNLVDSGHASKFLIIAAVRYRDQLQLQDLVTEFRLSLLRDPSLKNILSSAYGLDSFHASNDYPEVREKFYSFINTLDCKINVVAVDKLNCYEVLKQNPGKMYGVMAGLLLRNICHKSEVTEIIFSRKDSRFKLRKELEVEVERVRLEYMNDHQNLENPVKLSYFHNPHYSHGGLQVADYVAYAVFKVFESGERKWYEMIKNKIGGISDPCNKKYFTRSNPL